MTSYKEQHEQFISGHVGGTFQEVIILTSIPMVSIWSRDILYLMQKNRCRNSNKQKSSYLSMWVTLLLDFTLLVLPNIFSVTIMNNLSGLLFFGALCLGILLFYICYKIFRLQVCQSEIKRINLSDKKNFIAYFRSMMIICTAVGILAVDFPVYPRRLAKTEIYGFGLMDIGVGFYIVSNAIISPEARGKKSFICFTASLRKSVKSCIPLLMLGFARLASVKSMDYQEHVTEYGVHWNFFFTLAALKILCPAVLYFICPSYSAVLGCLLLAFHQFCLSVCGGSQYIINGSDGRGGRGGGIIDANREGVLSLPGSLVIYLFGVQTGIFIFKKRKNLKDWILSGCILLVINIIFMVLTLASHTLIQQVSRRFSNSAYIFWIMSASLNMVFLALIGDIAVTYTEDQLLNQNKKTLENTDSEHVVDTNQRLTRSKSKEFKVLSKLDSNKVTKIENLEKMKFSLTEAVNFNSLLFFLLANIMTGLVNMSTPTLHTGPLQAVAILVGYMFSICLIISVLKIQNISTKVW